MTEAQQWLDSKYKNKQSEDSIKLLDSEELSGEIKIEDYTATKEINLVHLLKGSMVKGKITKVTVKNCSALQRIMLGGNEIIAIVFEGDFPNLTQLGVSSNQLKEIELSKLPNLEFLNIARNPIDSQGIEKGLKDLSKLKFVNLLDTSGFNLKNMTNDDHADWINPNDIKNALGVKPTDPLPNDWKDKLDDLKKRPTQEDLNDAVKNAKDEFKDYINPKDTTDKTKLEQVAKEAGFINPKDSNVLEKAANEQGKTVINQTDLNDLKNNQEKHTSDQLEKHTAADLKPVGLPANWKTELAKIPGLEANKKPADYDAIKSELERWRKLGQNPEKVAQDIKDLQSRPVTGGTVLSPDQQQKLNDYNKIEKQKVWLLKYLKEIRSSGQYAQIEQQVNNIK